MHHTAVPINTRPFLSGHVCARVHVVTIFAVSDAISLTFTPTDITANCLLSVVAGQHRFLIVAAGSQQRCPERLARMNRNISTRTAFRSNSALNIRPSAMAHHSHYYHH